MSASKRSANEFYNKISFYILGIILFLTPMFQGLFYRHQIYWTGLGVSGLMIWHLWINRELLDFDFRNVRIIDIGLVGLLLAYVTSSFVAVKSLDAVDATLKMALYLFVYIIAVHLLFNVNSVRRMLGIIYISGVVVALLGIGAYAGLQIEGGIAETRISSTFQYPNALGGYLAVIGLIGSFLLTTTRNKVLSYIMTAGNIIVFTTLFGTGSRGALVALAVVYPLFILFQSGPYRVKTAASLILNLVFGGIAGYLIESKFGTSGVWGYLFLVSFAGCIVYYAFDFLGNLKISGTKKTAVVLIIMFVITALIGGFLIAKKPQFLGRITEISLKERNLVERGIFYADALKIIRDFPVMGTGGGGWHSLYKVYQSYGYTSTQVHNFYLQTWVEAGILGLVSLIIIIIGVFRSFIIAVKNQSAEDRAVTVAVMSAILVVAIQITIDFTLSYGAIGILLWTLFAILRSSVQNEDNTVRTNVKETFRKFNKFVFPTVMVTALGVITLCSSFIVGLNYEGKSIDALMKKDNDARMEYLKKSVIFNPLYADNYVNMALLERKMFNKDEKQEHLNKALEYAAKAVNRDKGNFNFRVERINTLFALQDFEKITPEAESAFRLARWEQESYHLLAYSYLSAGKYYLENGEKEKARLFLNKTLEITKIINVQRKQLSDKEKQLWGTERPVFDKKLQQYVGEAVVLLKKET